MPKQGLAEAEVSGWPLPRAAAGLQTLAYSCKGCAGFAWSVKLMNNTIGDGAGKLEGGTL